MLTKTTNTEVRSEAQTVAKTTTVWFSTPDRTTATQTPRPAVDDDAQWVTQRMFDHYNG